MSMIFANKEQGKSILYIKHISGVKAFWKYFTIQNESIKMMSNQNYINSECIVIQFQRAK